MFYPLNPDIAKTLHGIKKKMIFFAGGPGAGRQVLGGRAGGFCREPQPYC